MAGGFGYQSNGGNGGNGPQNQSGTPQNHQQQNHPGPPPNSQPSGPFYHGVQQQYSAPKPPSGGYDGPGEPSGPSRQNPFGPGMSFDPAKPAVKEKVITNTRIDLPGMAYNLERDYEWPVDLPARPGLNSTGKAITIRVNQFKVTGWPQKDVFQYDINIGNGGEAKGKVMAVWKSRAVQNRLAQFNPGGHHLLWDGNRLAWSDIDFPEQRINVNLDEEKGRPPRAPRPGQAPRAPDTCYCVIRKSKSIRMAVIQAYLQKQMPFDNSVLEAITFLDHAMRQSPSEQFTMIKRSFFARGTTSHTLDNVIVALKGVYTSIRLCDPKSSVGGPSTGLALNVDVANGTFWTAQDVHQAARNLCSRRNRNLDYNVFTNLVAPSKNNTKNTWEKTEEFKDLAKMVKLRFTVKHRGKNDDNKIYTIKTFKWKDVQGGFNAKNHRFTWKDKKTGADMETTVYEYFQQVYNINLQYWQLPLIETERAGFFPMELCTLVANQRYNFKLSPEQTASMIKFAVTRPKERLQSIAHGTGMLKWAQDPYLNNYDIKVDPNLTQTQARLLPNPEIQFGAGAKLNPGTQGRWDLRGKKFFLPNTEPLKSWGVCVIGGCTGDSNVRAFMQQFVQIYIGHGGKVENKIPMIYHQPKGEDLALTVHNTRLAAGNQAKTLPQILFYVLPARDSFLYERLKKNNECRFGLVSQCMNVAHVNKAQPQYCSNVAMKVNAKLGGTTCKAINQGKNSYFSCPTMILGADVSHPGVGSLQPSMSAITMSFDKEAIRYAAMCQTNGKRVEMIAENTIRSLFIPMFGQWVSKVGGGTGPAHIYYFRDGVSEGQYTHVIRTEVQHFKNALKEKYGDNAAKIKWTVVVCTKRHHIRFFPNEKDSNAADRNANPLPGTLVERDITHPFEYDFYLCSHSAIQGTARPVHYQVILDEAKVSINEFQKMVYQMSYQYMRSTTPVSLFPAVYYAHLASNRARAHETAPASDGPRGGQKFDEVRQAQGQDGRTTTSGSRTYSEAAPLLPLGNSENPESVKIRTTMWYI